MKWKVIDSLVSPSTGTIFSCVISARNLKLVLWYKASLFLKPGDEVTTSNLGVFINGFRHEVSLCNVTAYNAQLWQVMRENFQCPGNLSQQPGDCSFKLACNIQKCPYGVKKE